MLRLHGEGKTTLMVTHDMATAFAVSRRFSFIHDSRLVFEGSKADLEKSSIPAIREFFSPGVESLFRDSEAEGGDEA
jgi:phospholipid/cholesterol/gamma-HCH transport system ATP-binding protein